MMNEGKRLTIWQALRASEFGLLIVAVRPRAFRLPGSPTLGKLRGRPGAAARAREAPVGRGGVEAPGCALPVGRLQGLAQGEDDGLAGGELREVAAV